MCACRRLLPYVTPGFLHPDVLREDLVLLLWPYVAKFLPLLRIRRLRVADTLDRGRCLLACNHATRWDDALFRESSSPASFIIVCSQKRRLDHAFMHGRTAHAMELRNHMLARQSPLVAIKCRVCWVLRQALRVAIPRDAFHTQLNQQLRYFFHGLSNRCGCSS